LSRGSSSAFPSVLLFFARGGGGENGGGDYMFEKYLFFKRI